MRDINRIRPFLDKVEELWRLVPDQRFTQLIMNFLPIDNPASFYLEEEDVEHIIDQVINKLTGNKVPRFTTLKTAADLASAHQDFNAICEKQTIARTVLIVVVLVIAMTFI